MSKPLALSQNAPSLNPCFAQEKVPHSPKTAKKSGGELDGEINWVTEDSIKVLVYWIQQKSFEVAVLGQLQMSLAI